MPTPEMTLSSRLSTIVSTLWREVVKFGIIGAISFVIDLGGANLLWHTVLRDNPTTAKILSGVAATAFAWWGNRSWTFAHRKNRPAHHEALLFFLVNGIALLIGAALLYLTVYGLGYTSNLAKNVATILGIGLGTLFRFWCYRRFVFGAEAVGDDTSPMRDHHQDGQHRHQH